MASALSASARSKGGDGMTEWERRCWDNGRRVGSVMTPEEYAALSGEVCPPRPRRCRVTHGDVSVTVECPDAQAPAWAAWLAAVARQNGWGEEVTTR